MIKCLIFDFDGVVLESVEVKTEAYRKMYLPFGQAVADKVVAHHLANGGISRFEKFKIYHREFLNKDLSESEVQQLATQFSNLVERLVLESPFVPGAEEFFFKTKPQLPMFVASGTPEDELIRVVNHRHLAPFFKGVFGSPKSKSTIIQNILKMYGFDPREVLMVGDSINDYQPAQSNSIQFVGRVGPGVSNPFPPSVKWFDSPYEYIKEMINL